MTWLRFLFSPTSYYPVRISGWQGITTVLVNIALFVALVSHDLFTNVEASTTVVDVLSQSANFSQVVTALQLARLIPYINSLSNCTFFAPSDNVFSLRHDLRLLMVHAHKGREEARRELRDKLLYHLVPGDRWDRQHLLHQSISDQTPVSYMTNIAGIDQSNVNLDTDLRVRVLGSAYLNGTWMNGTGLAMRVELSIQKKDSENLVTTLLEGDDNGGDKRNETLPSMQIRVADSANILRPDLLATKGVVHEMDNFLIPPPDIATLLSRMVDTEQARQALEKINLEQQFSGPGPWTVFLPENQPFHDMHWVEKRYLAHERGVNDLSTLLSYHVHKGQVYASEINKESGDHKVETLQGESVQLTRNADQVSINGVPLKTFDMIGSNGVVHLLPSLLQPKALVMNSFKYLIGLDAVQFADDLSATGMDTLTNSTSKVYTFIAVADSALSDGARMATLRQEDLLRQVQYQIVPGSLVYNNASNNYQLARSILTDPEANGVHQPVRIQLDSQGQATHINDVEVAVGPVTIGEHTIYMVRAPFAAPTHVVDFLNGSKDSTTFLSALSDSGQLSQVRSQKGITLFVPTQAAFDSLGLVYDAMRLPDAAEKLRRVIKASIAVDGILYSDMITNKPYKIPTLDGGVVTLERAKDPENPSQQKLYLRGDSSIGANNATIVAPDLPIRNGVVHRIDNVVVPSGVQFTLRDLFRAAGGNTFLQAIDRLGLGSLIDSHKPSSMRGYTFFVPSDEAFAQFNDTLLFKDEMRMRRIILGHIVANRIIGRRDGGNIGFEFATLLKDRSIYLEFERSNGRLRVGMRRHGSDNKQLGEDRSATIERSGSIPMGVVHRIDVVLLDGRLPGWAWWIILLMVTGAGATLGGGGFYAHQTWMKRRRQGGDPAYTPIPDEQVNDE